MYGLKQDFDATVFVGRELGQICFSSNNIHFAFSDGVSITLESSFIHCDTLLADGLTQVVPVLSSDLMRLIGHAVSSAAARPDGTLSLVFDNGNSLMFLDDSKDYESYAIRIGDREIIV
jgi:hypothetical protein